MEIKGNDSVVEIIKDDGHVHAFTPEMFQSLEIKPVKNQFSDVTSAYMWIRYGNFVSDSGAPDCVEIFKEFESMEVAIKTKEVLYQVMHFVRFNRQMNRG